MDRIEPAVASDHLCWPRIKGFNSCDLLPLPHAGEAFARAMLIENPAFYLALAKSEEPPLRGP